LQYINRSFTQLSFNFQDKIIKYYNLLRLKKKLFQKQQLILFKKAYKVARSNNNIYFIIQYCNNYYFVFNLRDSIN